MWGLVQSGSITKIINNAKAMVIGDVQYPAKIFELWSKAELEAIGIYEVVFDNSNKKDEEFYINTNQSFNFAPAKILIFPAKGIIVLICKPQWSFFFVATQIPVAVA